MRDIKKILDLTKVLSVLYAEDDVNLQQRTRKLFERFFKKVDVVEDGKQALEAYKAHKDEKNSYYDLVITDIQMPYMNGVELSKAVLKINPEQTIVVTSAYSEKEYFIELINLGIKGFLQKPLNEQELFNVFERVASLLSASHIVKISEHYTYDSAHKVLLCENVRVELTVNEVKLLDLFCLHPNFTFTPVDIFNHIYYDQPEREFSNDAVKSLIKRLRQKIPPNLISNTPSLGYTFSIS